MEKTIAFQSPDRISNKDASHTQNHFEKLIGINGKRILKNFKKGQNIFLEGENAYILFCLMKGNVKLVKGESPGKEHIIKIIGPGNNIGYHAIIANTQYSHSAIAITDVQVCVIQKQNYLEIIKNDYSQLEELLRKLCIDYIEAEEFIKIISIKPTRERLAIALLDYTFREGDDYVCLSRSDLANIIGSAKETVTRLLTELRIEGIISIAGKNITVLNKQKLEKLKGRYE